MKKWFVVISLLLLVLPVIMYAEGIPNVRGDGSVAIFRSETECVRTVAIIGASNEKHREQRGDPFQRSAQAFVNLSQYDHCAGQYLMDAWGSVNLGRNDFNANGSLSRARLNTVIPVVDTVSGNTIQVYVNLDWRGTGTLVRQNERIRYETEEVVFHGHLRGRTREGWATGMIWDGVTNYANAPIQYSSLYSTNSGSVTIEKRH